MIHGRFTGLAWHGRLKGYPMMKDLDVQNVNDIGDSNFKTDLYYLKLLLEKSTIRLQREDTFLLENLIHRSYIFGVSDTVRELKEFIPAN